MNAPKAVEIAIIIGSTSSVLNNLLAPVAPPTAPKTTHVTSLAAKPITVAPNAAVEDTSAATLPPNFFKAAELERHLVTLLSNLENTVGPTFLPVFFPTFCATLEKSVFTWPTNLVIAPPLADLTTSSVLDLATLAAVSTALSATDVATFLADFLASLLAFLDAFFETLATVFLVVVLAALVTFLAPIFDCTLLTTLPAFVFNSEPPSISLAPTFAPFLERSLALEPVSWLAFPFSSNRNVFTASIGLPSTISVRISTPRLASSFSFSPLSFPSPRPPSCANSRSSAVFLTVSPSTLNAIFPTWSAISANPEPSDDNTVNMFLNTPLFRNLVIKGKNVRIPPVIKPFLLKIESHVLLCSFCSLLLDNAAANLASSLLSSDSSSSLAAFSARILSPVKLWTSNLPPGVPSTSAIFAWFSSSSLSWNLDSTKAPAASTESLILPILLSSLLLTILPLSPIAPNAVLVPL